MATDWAKLTVVELRAQLKKRGLPTVGKKAELVDRLAGAESGDATGEDSPAAPAGAVTGESDTHAVPEAVPSQEASDDTPSQKPDTDVTEPSAPPSKQADGAAITIPASVSTPRQVDSETIAPSSAVDETLSHTAQPFSQVNEQNSAVSEPVTDAQTRKRRSRSPPPSPDVARKRARPENGDVDMVDATESTHPNGVKSYIVETLPPKDEELHQMQSKSTESLQSSHYQAISKMDVDQEDLDKPRDLGMSSEDQNDTRADDGPAEDLTVVAPSLHPATASLYINDFMRPLRPAQVQDHLIELATPRGQNPDPSVIVDFYLDQIRTHAFVVFNSVSAASRARSALHDRVWPDERNRKALWVDFIPTEVFEEWTAREQSGGGGRGNLNRWEVVYEPDENGSIRARLDEVGANSTRPVARHVPAAVAADPPPSGPSRENVGIEGAPLGPRGGGERRPPGGDFGGESWRTTRSGPALTYKPVAADLAGRRIDKMRSFYARDQKRDMGREDEINRYTFEHGDSFVDRGKEVFIGIRPPHREREVQEMRRRGGGGGGGGGRGPPPSYPPRHDRFSGGSFRRDDFVPRSRFNGAPLPTYDPRSDRRGGGGYRGRY